MRFERNKNLFTPILFVLVFIFSYTTKADDITRIVDGISAQMVGPEAYKMLKTFGNMNGSENGICEGASVKWGAGCRIGNAVCDSIRTTSAYSNNYVCHRNSDIGLVDSQGDALAPFHAPMKAGGLIVSQDRLGNSFLLDENGKTLLGGRTGSWGCREISKDDQGGLRCLHANGEQENISASILKNWRKTDGSFEALARNSSIDLCRVHDLRSAEESGSFFASSTHSFNIGQTGMIIGDAKEKGKCTYNMITKARSRRTDNNKTCEKIMASHNRVVCINGTESEEIATLNVSDREMANAMHKWLKLSGAKWKSAELDALTDKRLLTITNHAALMQGGPALGETSDNSLPDGGLDQW